MVNCWSTSLFQIIDRLRVLALDSRAIKKNSNLSPKGNELSMSPAISNINAQDKCLNSLPTTRTSSLNAVKNLTSLTELRGETKWIIEGYKETEILIPGPIATNHSIYLFKCVDSVLNLETTKFTTASIDQCEHFGIVVDRVVSGIDIVRCKDVQIQIVGFCPTISIDSSDGVQIYLSKECIQEGTQIITSKTSTVNILIESKNSTDDYEWIEKPVPEQFISKVDPASYSIVTNPVTHI